MKKIFATWLLLTVATFLFAQTKVENIINAKEVERIERVLASDEMKGRRVFSPEIDKAADFIAAEFKAAGLESWNNSGTYRQEFTILTPRFKGLTCSFDQQAVDAKNVVVITTSGSLTINEKSGYEKVKLSAGVNLFTEAQKYIRSGKNYVVLVDTSYSKNFGRLTGFKRGMFPMKNNVVFVLTTVDPSTYSIEAQHEITEQKLSNVVGIIPGKSKKDEYVIFSGHYDHIGIGKPVDGDSIFNGANDDAAGTTAVIMLAKYYKALNNNERTIIFAAFTAEESGGYGAQYFSKQFDPAKVAAMFNIEMIGTESKWGKNSAYITGYEKTDMGAIMQKNLEGTGFTFHPDPYTDQNLFYRSDNATLARLGVPAHTISTSKMDSEPNYHKVSDEVETLDMDNMAMIIKSIALSARSIVAGKDSPTRVKVEELR
ncbi:M28 family peptidase [Lacibacter sediminis]|uniref:M20/M25/M40 family metallo-hydrolase n=1 Tax=Lacibacter sediminis TaxID=2760713 RepID=A0A7G5XF02_9BACT|nr:M28 family peptidase [Lacibacter sediminis]QNA44055.1 M20/M25/M40 family metallo-hydrolase [Lacibacter sediminis]